MEMIDDIVREWRTNCDQAEADADHLGIDCVYDVSEVRDLLDRIEKAYKSLEAEKSRIIAERNELAEVNRKCCDENERLKDENSNLRSLVVEMTVGLSGALDIIGDVSEYIEVDCGTALRVETYREILAKAREEVK